MSMGLGDFVEKWGTKVGKFALKKAKEAGDRIQVAQERAQGMSSEDLIRNFKWASNLERSVYGQELKNRGWYLKNGKWMQ